MPKFLTLLFSLAILTGKAQQSTDFHIQQYTTENGLPSNGIKGLQWDENTNFLWIATEAGIVRFNGVDFRSYTRENMPSIGSERLLFMEKNNAGRIYISDQPGNILFIDKNKPVLWKKAAVNNSNNPYLINYYLLKVSETFFQRYAGSLTTSRFSTGYDKLICSSDTSFLVLNQGTVFYNSISLSDPVRLSFIKEPISTIFKINSNCFITNNKREIFLLNYPGQTLRQVAIQDTNGRPLTSAADTSVIYWQTGMANPILIDGEKAYKLTFNGSAVIARLIFTGIPAGSFIRSIQYSEKNRLLFIGTESKGVIVLNENRVQSMKRTDVSSKNRNSYYSQVALTDGNILTNEGDIIGGNSTVINTLPIRGRFSFNVSQTNDSLLWYNQAEADQSYVCLHQYNKSGRQTKIFNKIRGGEFVTASGKDIYLANANGIGMLKDDSFLFVHKYTKELAGQVTFDFTEISPGILAIATCAGLLRFNTVTGKLDTLFTKENICVRSIWKYKDYIFFGTYGGGYFIYRNGQLKAMPLDKNKFLLYTHCFVRDNNGYCWISTNRGLFKANLDELINVFEKNTDNAYYHYFGRKDGMEMTELNGGCTPCALALKNNTISFPSMDGLLWVDPEKALPLLPDGDIYIDDVIIDNENKDPEYLSGRALPAGTADIVIRLAFSAWCNKENIYLEYQLNDTLHWKPVNFENGAEIKFNNLPYGSYELRIRKLNGFGYNNYSYRNISFSITTPWHNRWWFYVLAGLVAMGLTAIYVRIKTNQHRVRQQHLEKQVAEKTKELLVKNEVLEKNNSIKTRLISIISHDIITPLKFVTVAGQNLIAKRALMTEELQQETIKEITNTSQELHLLTTNILNWIKYQNENRRIAKENFSLHEMISQVFGILNSLARQKNLELANTVNSELKVFQYFEPLKILIYNLLTNAINFSEKGAILATARQEGENMIIEVKDEGVGMTPDQIKNIMSDQFIISSANIDNRKGNGLGYLIIKDLVKMMDAQMNISSKRGTGTTVSVVFSLK